MRDFSDAIAFLNIMFFSKMGLCPETGVTVPNPAGTRGQKDDRPSLRPKRKPNVFCAEKGLLGGRLALCAGKSHLDDLTNPAVLESWHRSSG